MKAIARLLGFNVFTYEGYRTQSLNDVAADQTSGITHYYDKATLRYHGSRITHIETLAEGLLLATICRDSLDYNKTAYGFRVVIHAIDGHCVQRCDLENCHKTKSQAMQELIGLRDRFNPNQVMQQIVMRKQLHVTRELSDLTEAMRQLCVI